MLLPIALSAFCQMASPVLSPSALASSQGWSQELEESVRVVAPKHYESGLLPIYQRFFGDFPLHGSRYVLQEGGGQKLLSLRSDKNYSQRLPGFDNLFPTVDELSAVEMAVANLTNSSSSVANIVWFNRRSHVQLCWEVVTLLEDTGEPVCPTHIESIVDGQTGRVLSQRQLDTNDYSPADASQNVWGVFPRIVVNNEMGVQGGRTYGSDFDAVCYLLVELDGGFGAGTGILIAPDVVITARHNEAGPGDLVAFGDNLNNAGGLIVREVQSSFLPDGDGDLFDGGDVAILTLDSPVPSTVAEPMKFIDLTNELEGMQCAAVGYGLNGLGSSGHGFSEDGYRWGGENIIDRYGSPAVPPGEPPYTGVNIISTDFDNGTSNANTIGGSSPNPLELEATTAPGDSGGPLLVQQDGQWLIAGVLSGGSTPLSTYGDISWWTGTSWFRSDIETYGGVFVDDTSSGACCFSSGFCVSLDPGVCESSGGFFFGLGVACPPVQGTCEIPEAEGACCFEDGSCELSTESACGDAGGTYQGESVECDPNNCPQPPTLGACCLPSDPVGICVPDLDEIVCIDLGGSFAGVGSVCSGDSCAEPPEPCDPFECPPGSNQSLDETCDDTGANDSNGGCNTGVPYVPIAEGEVVCGTIWASNGSRDTDWYGYAHAGGLLEWTVECDGPCVAFIISPEAQCENAAVLFGGDSDDATCGSAVASGNLAAGTYGMFVAIGGAGGAGIFEGYPCDSGFNSYTAFAGTGAPPPPPCLTDLDGNGATDFQDLVQILSNYGPCPE